MTKPLFEHDCTVCTFIGTFEYLGEKLDAWKSCEASSDDYIARYGSDGDYITVGICNPMHKVIAQLEETIASDASIDNLRNARADAYMKREAILTQLYEVSKEIDSLQVQIATATLDQWRSNEITW
jgi:hypothetical protein